MKLMRRMALWMVWYVPLGPLAPWVMGFALNSWPERVKGEEK